MTWSNDDETQPAPRISSQTLETRLPEPEKAPRSAQEPPAGTRARHAPRRARKTPSWAVPAYARWLRPAGRVALAPLRALADRWADIWPPAVGIFFGCLAGGTALVLIFSAFINWSWC